MEADAVDRQYRESKELIDFLTQKGEVSFVSAAQDQARKALLMAAASTFEHEITTTIVKLANTAKSTYLAAFVRNKAVSRQYHTYFDWSRKNANQFFSFFGEEFKKVATEQTEKDPSFAASVSAFMSIGKTRNELVHQDFATFSLNLTLDEIYSGYQSAREFVRRLPDMLGLGHSDEKAVEQTVAADGAAPRS